MHNVFTVALAYQIYDLIIMAFQQTDPPLMWIHHIISVIGFAALMEQHQTSFYPLAFMTTEITVLFVNSLWYVRSLVPDWKKMISFLTLMRTLSYIFFRSWVGPWVLYKAFIAGDHLRLGQLQM